MKKILLSLLLLANCFFVMSQNQKTFPVAQIKTNKGVILIWLYDETPNHKASFIKLANEHYWDSLTFNRVIKDFVAQGGCPDTPEGFSNSPYLLKPEFTGKLRHKYGAVGAGQDGNKERLSAGCQFYIVQNKEGLARLDDKFTVFGQVFKGMDVVDQIVSVRKDTTDKPFSPIPLDIDIVQMSRAELKKNGFDLEKMISVHWLIPGSTPVGFQSITDNSFTPAKYMQKLITLLQKLTNRRLPVFLSLFKNIIVERWRQPSSRSTQL